LVDAKSLLVIFHQYKHISFTTHPSQLLTERAY